MKNILIILLLFVGCSANAQLDTSLLTGVFEVPEVSKVDLYNRAKIWIARSFISANDVIQMDDKENGLIIGKGTYEYSASAFSPGTNYSGWFRFMLTLDFKDGKARYRVERLQHESKLSNWSVGDMMPEKNKGKPGKGAYQKMQRELTENLRTTITELRKALSSSQSDDW